MLIGVIVVEEEAVIVGGDGLADCNELVAVAVGRWLV